MAIPASDIAPMVITTVLTVAVAGTIVLRGPLGRALARAIELGAGGGGRPPEDEARVVQLEQRVAELEAGQARVAELEERMDFAERLLARPDAAGRLPGGGEAG
jgi:hypothetical protein